jgi:chromate transporter
MNIVLLYLLLLKGTITAFAGLASLPVIQESLVNHYHVLTNEQLNEAVVITRSSPGPVGSTSSASATSPPACQGRSPAGLP